MALFRIDDITGGGPSGAQTRPAPKRRTPTPKQSDAAHGQRRTRTKAAPAPKPTPAPKPSPSRTTTSRGSGGGGGSSAPGMTRTFVPDPGPSPAERQAQQAARQAEQRAREAAAARERQLAEMRAAIQAQPLDPSLVAAFAERERLAGRGVQQAEAFGQRAEEQSGLDFEQFQRLLGQQTDQAIGGLRQEAAARNLAFQPAFVGVGMRDIRDQATDATSMAQDQRAQFLSGIERQISQAQQAKQAEVAAIARERARAQADHRSFIDRQLAALGT